MIKMGTDLILKFFNTCTYKPLIIHEQEMVEWPGDLEEFIFASPTSLVDGQFIKETLIKEGLLKEEKNKDDDVADAVDEQDSKPKKAERDANELRPQTLVLGEEPKNKQRVSIEAVDFDWIFGPGNCKALITLLANYAKKQLYVTRAFKIFISLMWKNYQPKIVLRMLVPFIVYLILFMFMASKGSGEFLDALNAYEHEHAKARENDAAFHAEKTLILVVSVFCILFWLFFARIELVQLIEDPREYLMDYWNCCDLVSILLNAALMGMVDTCLLAEKQLVNVVTVRTVGSLAMFFLWIKVFYWGRLFKSTAHFITLIVTTCCDIRTFVVMLFIIIGAFANFFLIINNNTPDNAAYKAAHPKAGDFHYIGTYVGNPLVDSIIGVYLISLGEFDLDGYNEGPNVYLVWLFFILCTFFILIVFMNMLIAIMGDTFSAVQGEQVESGLSE